MTGTIELIRELDSAELDAVSGGGVTLAAAINQYNIAISQGWYAGHFPTAHERRMDGYNPIWGVSFDAATHTVNIVQEGLS